MKSRFLLLLLLASCASSKPSPSNAAIACEPSLSRPFSAMAKKGEVYVERTVGESCDIQERLVWGKSSILLKEGEWRAGGLTIWKGQVALDLHKYFEGHPIECQTWLYRFGKNALKFQRKSKTCGP